jgi:uncharacterized protein (DUF2062 family)
MRHRLRQIVGVLLQLEGSPRRTALAFAIGVWIAFCPLIGIHTGLALLIAFLFRLNRVALLLGSYVNNPWTLAPLFMAGTFLGCLLLGVSPGGVSAIEWPRHMSALRETLARLRPLLWPYIVGNLALGTLCAAVAYGIVLRLLESGQRSARPVGPTGE